MDQFVEDLCSIWADLGLEFKPSVAPQCPAGPSDCGFCHKPVLFDQLEARESSSCGKENCPMISAAA